MTKLMLFMKTNSFQLAVLLAVTSFLPLFAQSNGNDDSTMLDAFIRSESNLGIVVFDRSNIKQFWVDRSVLSRDKFIEIILNGNEKKNSPELPIQLANVNETMDCKVRIVTDDPAVFFSVSNSKSTIISESSLEQEFIHDYIISSLVHLEQTNDFHFNIKFFSNKPVLHIKKIFLSFSTNKDSVFLVSPGHIKVSKEFFLPSGTRFGENDFEITGSRSRITSKKNILVTDNTIKSSITIKNTGKNPSQLYIGYAAYTKDGTGNIDSRNYPYDNTNPILYVVSAEKGSKTIIVDKTAKWRKGCFLVQDAKEDLSDIPNTKLINSRIDEAKDLENGQMEITLTTPLTKALEKGSCIRIHGVGGSLIYMHNKTLAPGEEETFSSSIKKDNSFLEYSRKSFSRGVYYVKPIILSFSPNPQEENTILIKNFEISY